MIAPACVQPTVYQQCSAAAVSEATKAGSATCRFDPPALKIRLPRTCSTCQPANTNTNTANTNTANTNEKHKQKHTISKLTCLSSKLGSCHNHLCIFSTCLTNTNTNKCKYKHRYKTKTGKLPVLSSYHQHQAANVINMINIAICAKTSPFHSLSAERSVLEEEEKCFRIFPPAELVA